MHSKVELDIGGRKLSIETGLWARQATGAAMVRYGDTVVFSAVSYNRYTKSSEKDWFPLTVDYREQTYAGGKIPGGFFKREGRPREKEILGCRVIDRPIRPLFPEGFRKETQINSYLLSSDLENEGEILGIISASAAMSVSEMPFGGPIGAVRIGHIDGQFVVNPTLTQLDSSLMNFVVCGNKDHLMMLEGEAREIPNDLLLQALEIAQAEVRRVVAIQDEMVRQVGKPKYTSDEPLYAEGLEAAVKSLVGDQAKAANDLGRQAKQVRAEAVMNLENQVTAALQEKYPECESKVAEIIDAMLSADMRRRIIGGEGRLDGRKPSDIRPINVEVGLLPRTHGSALFTRGETQALVVTTLGTKSDEQVIDDVEREEKKSFMLHYNFPGFSVGEVKMSRGPSRREIGHGALAERSVAQVLPKDEIFPYTIRVVSDILESNGSSSMATICGASLALMDAGVPIKAPVAGVAMGLIKEGDRFEILTDILGAEDHYGDMDLKVAGTREGITGVQLDLKVSGIPHEVMVKALEHATEARLRILDIMEATLPKPRPDISKYAPRMAIFFIPKDRIGEVIGPGGKNIRKILEATGTEIDIEDDGKVHVSGIDPVQVEKAAAWIKSMVEEVEVGKIYEGEVTRIMNFGAFVEVLPGQEGLVHISELANERVNRVEDVVKIGDRIKVKAVEIDDQGRINLSKRLADFPDSTRPVESRSGGARPHHGGGDRGGRGGHERRGGGHGGPRRDRR
jgi:polyribonucleotide nucleotidyltransferase